MNHHPLLQTFTKVACALTLALGLVTQAHAQSKTVLNLDKSGVAVQGYDVVGFFADGKAEKGNPQFSSSYSGGVYHFTSADHKATFDKDPAKYAPQFGGYCAWGVTKNSLVNIEPDAFQIVNGRLLLQYDKDIRDKFAKDPAGNLSKADAIWPALVAKKAK